MATIVHIVHIVAVPRRAGGAVFCPTDDGSFRLGQRKFQQPDAARLPVAEVAPADAVRIDGCPQGGFGGSRAT